MYIFQILHGDKILAEFHIQKKNITFLETESAIFYIPVNYFKSKTPILFNPLIHLYPSLLQF